MARRNEAQGWEQMSPLCPPWPLVPGQRRAEHGEMHKDGCHLPFCKRKPENVHRCVKVRGYSYLILTRRCTKMSTQQTTTLIQEADGDGRPLHLHPQLQSSTDKKRSFLFGGFIFSCLWQHHGGLFCWKPQEVSSHSSVFSRAGRSQKGWIDVSSRSSSLESRSLLVTCLEFRTITEFWDVRVCNWTQIETNLPF